MELPIIEILILLFILFPFIKDFIDRLKGEQQKDKRPERTHRTQQPDPWEQPDEFDWGDQQSEKELEEIFTRQTSRERRPETSHSEHDSGLHQRRTEPSSRTTETPEPIALSENPYEADMPVFNHQEHEPIDMGGKNPIYGDEEAEQSGGNIRAARQIRKTIADPAALRSAFIFKEVLDRPARRGGRPPAHF